MDRKREKNRAYRTYRKAAVFLAKEDLGQAFRLEQIILSKFEQITALRLLAGKATAAAEARRISGPGSHSPLERAVIRIVTLEEEIARDIQQLMEQKRRIAWIVGSVEHPEHRLLLELRYLNFLSWEVIAERMNYSTRQIHRLHGQALASLTEAGDESGEGEGRHLEMGKGGNGSNSMIGDESEESREETGEKSDGSNHVAQATNYMSGTPTPEPLIAKHFRMSTYRSYQSRPRNLAQRINP